MNILFLYTGEINPMKGGIQRVTSVLSEFFETASGNNIFFLSSTPDSDVEQKDSRQHFLPDSSAISTPENEAFFTKFIKTNYIDVVINQGGNNPELSNFAYLAKRTSTKLISVVHNSPLGIILNYREVKYFEFKKNNKEYLYKLLKYPIAQKVLKFLYKRKYGQHYNDLVSNSNKVFLLSDKFKDELAFFLDRECPNSVVGIPNPVSFQGELNVDLAAKKKEVLFMSRIDFEQKRPDFILDIWKKVAPSHKDWHLNIVGGGKDLEELKQMAKDLGLENLSILGFQEALPYYQNASIFTMTSTFEGFPMGLVEAMQCGTVPMAFESFASVTDIIDDGKNGVLVTPFDTDEYAKKLSELMSNDDMRQSYAKAGLEKVKDFSLLKVGTMWFRNM